MLLDIERPNTETQEFDKKAFAAINAAMMQGKLRSEALELEQSPSRASLNVTALPLVSSDLVEWLGDDYLARKQFLMGVFLITSSKCVSNPECIIAPSSISSLASILQFKEDARHLITQIRGKNVDVPSGNMFVLAQQALAQKSDPSDWDIASLADELSRFKD